MAELELNKFRKDVVAPFSGQRFTIRRVSIKEFLTGMGQVPMHLTKTVQEALNDLKEKAEQDPEAERQVTQFYLTRGVVAPKVWFGSDGECPEGQICAGDLGGDGEYLVGEIIHWSYELAGLADMERFFRGTGAGPPGPDGQEIRAEAVEPAADGGVQN